MSSGSKRDLSVNSYIPKYVKPDMKWYERDGLMTYVDQIKYEEYSCDPDKYISRLNVVNFDLIHAQCRGEAPSVSEKFYKTVKEANLAGMPTKKRNKSVSACLRSNRKDIFVEKKITFNHFRNIYNK